MPSDFGPHYTETLLGRFPVEPWNTYSNLIFLFIIYFWGRRVKSKWREFPFLTVTLPILFVGFIGGTVFHATRSHWIWLFMDFMPIFILSIAASFFFWTQYFRSKLKAFCACCFFVLFVWFIRNAAAIPIAYRIGIGYSSLAILIILPAVLLSKANNWRGIKFICLSILSFSIAITCRQIDKSQTLLPMGTHFLWHIFGGLATFTLIWFIWIYEKLALELRGSIVDPQP